MLIIKKPPPTDGLGDLEGKIVFGRHNPQRVLISPHCSGDKYTSSRELFARPTEILQGSISMMNLRKMYLHFPNGQLGYCCTLVSASLLFKNWLDHLLHFSLI